VIMIIIIAAFAQNRVIGKDGEIPWHLPEDLKRFARITKNHPVIMGRKTYESILKRNGKPLSGRTNIVLTKMRKYRAKGCQVVHSWKKAVAAAGNAKQIFVIGGESIYKLALPHAEKMYLTTVYAKVEGDTMFPPYSPSEWRVDEAIFHRGDDKHQFPYSFCTLVREVP